MEDKRIFNRWCNDEGKVVSLTHAGVTEDVKMVDVSAGGMRITSSHPLEYGAVIHGRFEILPQLGPYFVIGKVTRVTESDSGWDTAVQFDKISTIPIENLG
jgi:hypothetical protein